MGWWPKIVDSGRDIFLQDNIGKVGSTCFDTNLKECTYEKKSLGDLNLDLLLKLIHTHTHIYIYYTFPIWKHATLEFNYK